MMEPMGDYEKEQQELSGLNEVQRTIQCLKKKDYSDDVIQKANALAKAVADEDAAQYDDNGEKKMTSKDMERDLIKKKIVVEVDDTDDSDSEEE